MTKEAIAHIRKEQENGDPDEIVLDNIKLERISEELKRELEGLEELMCLSFNDCGLVSLNHLPANKGLIRLELMNNKFPARELTHLEPLTSLQSLSLGSNAVQRLEDLEPLKKLGELVQLDLSDSPLSKTEDYRAQVFKFLPQLQILDNCDLEGNEYQYTSEGEDGEDGEEGDEEEDVSFQGEDGEEDDDEEDEGDEDEEEGDEDEDEEDEEEEDFAPQKRVKK